MRHISIDIETFSSADLKKSGVFRYAEADDFSILLFAYAVDGGEVSVVDLASGEEIPPEILSALTDDSVQKWCHNAMFERVCLSRHLGETLNPVAWRCTMVWCAYMGMPLSLESVGEVLGLEKQKLSGGKDLIRYFCKPCKPTKVNGGRTRNLPEHAPEKWAAFKDYNRRDVEAEMAIQARLAKFPVPENIWDEYVHDQQINDRGIAVDMVLVKNAIAVDERSKAALLEKMRVLTGLSNPNSVPQLQGWFADNGLKIPSLDKDEVKAQLKTEHGVLREVLILRQQIAKTSVKKYQAMQNSVCKDGRVRGMFQFYGANRTGRWAGRLVQLHNLPRNYIPDLADARGLVRQNNYVALEMLYRSVPDVLSQLIRTAFVPEAGRRLIVADFSSIERVVLAWLAKEQWVMDAYNSKQDLYSATASQMFKVPLAEIDKKSPLRQRGKVADLACIAEGELVLTNSGLVPIEKITTAHKVWDGEDWVSHDGVVFNGEREVIEYDGLRATTDHLVWIEGESGPVQFGLAAASGAHLVQTGNGRQAVRLGGDYIPGKEMEQGDESLLCPYKMQRVRGCSMAASEQSSTRQIAWMPKLLPTSPNSTVAGQKTNCRQATVRKPKRPRLSQLWRQGNQVEICVCVGSRAVYLGNIRKFRPQFRNRQDRYKRSLRNRKYLLCHAYGEQLQQADYGAFQVDTRTLALLLWCGDSETFSRIDKGADYRRCGNGDMGKTEKLDGHSRKTCVYDIRNAGRNHRFTVSGKLVHNCGYGGSVGALINMGALEQGLSEDELKPLVDTWRKANPKIVGFWYAVDRAAITAVDEKKSSKTHGIEFMFQSGMLFIKLPSGRRLAYVKPRIGTNRFDEDCVEYQGINDVGKWGRVQTYGAKLVENIVQALSRDALAYAMQTLQHYQNIVAHVHDEVVLEAHPLVSVEAVCNQMAISPPWAAGLKLRVEGFDTQFYQKD